MAEDLSGWLRKVRPPTVADEAWGESADADQVLAHLHERIDANMATDSASDRRTRRRRTRVLRIGAPGLVLAGAAAAAVVLASIGSPTPAGDGSGSAIAGSANGGGTGPNQSATRPSTMLLTNFDSCSSLLAGLRTQTAAHVDDLSVGWSNLRSAALSPAAMNLDGAVAYSQSTSVAAGTPVTAGATSTTNNQEAGVDEPDVVKTDGGRLVLITGGVLRVVDGATHKITGTLDLTMYEGWQGAQLFVEGEHVLVILDGATQPYGYAAPSVAGGVLRPSGMVVPSAQKSTYLFVDLAGRPHVTGSLRASGNYVDARMVGSTVRLVVRNAPQLALPRSLPVTPKKRTSALRRVIAHAPLSTWLPSYTISAGYRLDTTTVGCGSVSHPVNYTGTSLLTIYTLDLEDLASGPAPVSVAADGDTVYANASSLYVATNPGWFYGSSAHQTTEVHRFDIRGTGRPTYLGSGSVPGRLLSQYSLSDYDGHLRVATTVNRGTSNAVYVLRDDTLAQTGRVTGLGQGERIYSVRFEGPVGYVVTFRETDPLYVLDLRDPVAPTVSGHLDLTGYSGYLHDAGDGRLIGVGQQANRQGRVAGLQVSLFDVANPARPARVGHVVLAHTQDESQFDPHAFLYWLPTGLTVVPVPGGRGTVLVLRVDGRSLRKVGTIANQGSAQGGSYIQRSVLLDGTLWTVSASGVRVSDPSTLAKRAWIRF